MKLSLCLYDTINFLHCVLFLAVRHLVMFQGTNATLDRRFTQSISLSENSIWTFVSDDFAPT
jgi:hypothetical protein